MSEVSFYPPITEPTVQWNHVDGPMMRRRDGTLYWLRWRDRFMHWVGKWSLREIERRSYSTTWGC